MALFFSKEEANLERCPSCGGATFEEKRVMQLSKPDNDGIRTALHQQTKYICTGCHLVLVEYEEDGRIHVKK